MKNDAYTRAYASLRKEMLSYLSKRLNDKSMAEDLFHDAFVKALSAESDREIEDINAWLRRVVQNVMIDYVRIAHRHKSNTDVDILTEESSDSTIDLEVHHVFAQFMRAFVEALPEKYSEAIILKEYEGCSVRAISEQLSISPSAVKSRLFRGRQQLRLSMEQCCTVETDTGIITDFTPNNCPDKSLKHYLIST